MYCILIKSGVASNHPELLPEVLVLIPERSANCPGLGRGIRTQRLPPRR